MADPIVSFEDEPLILVDADDQIVGYADKKSVHDGEGMLHRAFSVFVFDAQGRLLLQQRAEGKRLWGGIWANSCCSHPRKGEELDAAARRRTAEELGMSLPLTHLFSFEYHASWKDLGSEHELCHVFVGRSDAQPSVNAREIQATRWLSPDEVDAELQQHPERYSPWLHLEWRRIRSEHWDVVEGLTAS